MATQCTTVHHVKRGDTPRLAEETANEQSAQMAPSRAEQAELSRPPLPSPKRGRHSALECAHYGFLVYCFRNREMETQERAEMADTALQDCIQKLASRVNDRERSERLVFEQRASALREAKRLRQSRKESLEQETQDLQQEIQNLQQEIQALQQEIRNRQQEQQELDSEDAADDSKMRQLEAEYNAVTEKLKGVISMAISSIVCLGVQVPFPGH